MKDVKSQEKFIQTTINGYRLFVLTTISFITVFTRLCGRFVCVSKSIILIIVYECERVCMGVIVGSICLGLSPLSWS